jgi:hypothetical protein
MNAGPALLAHPTLDLYLNLQKIELSLFEHEDLILCHQVPQPRERRSSTVLGNTVIPRTFSMSSARPTKPPFARRPVRPQGHGSCVRTVKSPTRKRSCGEASEQRLVATEMPRCPDGTGSNVFRVDRFPEVRIGHQVCAGLSVFHAGDMSTGVPARTGRRFGAPITFMELCVSTSARAAVASPAH